MPNEAVELRLFGSRTNDFLKGGDIDLLIVTKSIQSQNSIAFNKARILAKIYMQIEEQKIDITVVNRDALFKDRFAQSIMPSSLLLHTWPDCPQQNSF